MFNFPPPAMPPVGGVPQPGQPPQQGLQLPNSPMQLPFMPNQPLNAQTPMQMNDMSKLLPAVGALTPQPGSHPPPMSPPGVNPLDFIGKMLPQNGTPGPMQRPPMTPNRNGFQGTIPQGPNLGSLGNALLQQGGLPQGNQQTMARRGKGKDYNAQ